MLTVEGRRGAEGVCRPSRKAILHPLFGGHGALAGDDGVGERQNGIAGRGRELGVDMDAVVEWVNARERLPRDGMPVAAAITGRYPAGGGAAPGAASGPDFWLVMPMYFTTLHIGEDGTEYRECFIDSDRIIRLPYGRPCAEPVTHWAYLPTLPGMTVHHLEGEGALTALRHVRDE
ncbi:MULTISPECIES: AQJ64_40280 family protein [unclassified Nonomuraea]|uniref:AQJ64_40280 family protein n=1 Tax=unclassified Nonomuraea TaxID=2593643 RepID=UPI0033C5CA25